MPVKKKNNFNEVFETVDLAKEFLTMQLDASKSSVISLGYDWDKLIDIVKDEENNSSLLVFAREVNERIVENDEGEEEEVNESSEEKTKIYMEKELDEIAENVKSIYEATSEIPFDDGTIHSLDSKEEIEEYVGELFDVLIQARDYVNSEKEIKNLEEEAFTNSEEFIKSRNTKEYEEGQDKKCKEWKKELEEYEADENNRQKNYRKIRGLKERIMLTKQRYSQEFFFDSIPSVERLKETFFKDKDSAYTMQRFSAKCKTLGISPNFYMHFFYIEEKFLPEEYHPFNNLLIYTVIRYIAWSDVERDRYKINTVVRALYKLMDNRFATDKLRQTYINAIKKYLDRFIVWEDEFRENNITWKEHPKRIEKDKAQEEKYREQMYGNIMKMGYAESIDETLQNMTLDELREFIDKKNIEKLEAAKKAGEEKAKAREAEEEDEEDENTSDVQGSIVIEGWNDLKAGDILVKDGHTEIFYKNEDGKHLVFSCGSTDGLASEEPIPNGHESFTTVWRNHLVDNKDDEEGEDWLSVVKKVKALIADLRPTYDLSGSTASINYDGKEVSFTPNAAGFVGCCLKVYGSIPEDTEIESKYLLKTPTINDFEKLRWFTGEKDHPKEVSDGVGLTDTLEKVEDNEDE